MVLISMAEKSGCGWAREASGTRITAVICRSFIGWLAAAGRIQGGLELVIKTRSTEVHFVNHPFVADDVDFPALVCCEGSNPLRRGSDLPNHLQRPILLFEPKNSLGSVVTEYVYPVKRGALVPAIHVTTG